MTDESSEVVKSESPAEAQLGAVARFRNYLSETRAELRKVVWPTREEATNLTVAVLFVTLLMTILLGSVDWFFSQLLEWVVQAVVGA